MPNAVDTAFEAVPEQGIARMPQSREANSQVSQPREAKPQTPQPRVAAPQPRAAVPQTNPQWADVPQSRSKARKMRKKQDSIAAQQQEAASRPQKAWASRQHPAKAAEAMQRPPASSNDFSIEYPSRFNWKAIVAVLAIVVVIALLVAGIVMNTASGTVTVKYDSCGGSSAHFSSGALTTEVVKVGDTYGSGSFDDGNVHNAMPSTERNGYTFIGWYTEQYGGERVSSDTRVTNSGNHTLYAHWK